MIGYSNFALKKISEPNPILEKTGDFFDYKIK
jgi:hypothetical protein